MLGAMPMRRAGDVTLTSTATALDLHVSDDGCGFDPGLGAQGYSYGCLACSERARLIGGVAVDRQLHQVRARSFRFTFRLTGGEKHDQVLIADDHAIVRGGLKQIIATTTDIVVAGEAAQGSEVRETSCVRSGSIWCCST